MDEGDALQRARDWLEALNDGERERFRKTLAPDAVFVQRGDGREDAGAEAVEEACFRWRGLFVGLHADIAAAFGTADRAALEIVWRGIVRETGVHVAFPACLLFALEGGRIARIAGYYDRLFLTERARG